MAALLRRTLYLASRHKDKKVAGAAVMAFGYLLRTSVTSEGMLCSSCQWHLDAALKQSDCLLTMMKHNNT